MSKFKVGDRVRLLNLDRPDGGLYHENNYNPLDCEGTVDIIYDDDDFGMDIHVQWDNGFSNCYTESNLGLVEDEQEYTKQFTKDDLEIGMILKFQDGRFGVLLSKDVVYFLLEEFNTWFNTNNLGKDLQFKVSEDYDSSCYNVVAVYKPKSNITSCFDVDEKYLDCIWERPLTRKQEIEKQIKELQKELEELK